MFSTTLAKPLLGIWLLFASASLWAQPPNWSPPSPQDFDNPNTMTAVVVVAFDGALSDDPADQVAVFHNGQLHGLGEMLDYTDFGLPANIYFSITVYGNGVDNGQSMEFRVYHAATDAVYTSSTTLPFVFTRQFGSFSDPEEVRISATGLPVELSQFTASYRGKSVLLRWETVSESGNAGFLIERSTDGRAFNEIGFVAGRGGPARRAAYDYRDLSTTVQQRYFYRLRQRDYDGTEWLSAIVSAVPPKPSAAVRLFPNPVVADELYLQGLADTDKPLSIYLLSGLGQEIRRWSFTSGTGLSGPLSLPHLPAGQYWLRVERIGGESTLRSFFHR
ncbi:MAG: T9SS type A sorting domain-containing protein [Bacteroidota bacterium]